MPLKALILACWDPKGHRVEQGPWEMMSSWGRVVNAGE